MAGEMRKRTSEQTECPVCGAQLQGSRFSGYSCAKCGSHFSGRFMMHLRKREFKSRIAAHFGVATAEAVPSPAEPSSVPSASQETQEFIVKDDGRIQETIERLHETVHDVVGEVGHGVQQLESVPLEEILGGTTEAVSDSPPEPSRIGVRHTELQSLKRSSTRSPVAASLTRKPSRKSAKKPVVRKPAVNSRAVKSPSSRGSPVKPRGKTSVASPKLRKRITRKKPSPVKRKRPR